MKVVVIYEILRNTFKKNYFILKRVLTSSRGFEKRRIKVSVEYEKTINSYFQKLKNVGVGSNNSLLIS